MVAGQLQRFCQQCCLFQPIASFDNARRCAHTTVHHPDKACHSCSVCFVRLLAVAGDLTTVPA